MALGAQHLFVPYRCDLEITAGDRRFIGHPLVGPIESQPERLAIIRPRFTLFERSSCTGERLPAREPV
jgi:hypothetical protein